MLNLFKYSNISTKISAMKGQMLKHEDYQKMLAMQTVNDIGAFLKNETYYKVALSELNEKDTHRGHLEVLLYKSELIDSLKIARYLKDHDKEIFRYVYRKQEIEDLKKMIRTLQAGKSLSDLSSKDLFIHKYSKLNFNEALKSSNLAELIETLKGTRFYNLLKPLLISETKIDIFSAEAILDMYYYNRLKEVLEGQTSLREKKLISSFFGIEADLKNILWLYRGKKYYEINKEMLYRYLIPFSYKLKKAERIKLIEAKDMEIFIKILFETYYGGILGEDPHHWEIELLQYFYETQYKNMKNNPYSIAPIIGYIVLKEIEIENIVAIVEGVRYQVQASEIEKLLIGHAK